MYIFFHFESPVLISVFIFPPNEFNRLTWVKKPTPFKINTVADRQGPRETLSNPIADTAKSLVMSKIWPAVRFKRRHPRRTGYHGRKHSTSPLQIKIVCISRCANSFEKGFSFHS